MVTLADVTAMLPLITPYSMPTDTTQAQLLFDITAQKVTADSIPSDNNILLTKAYCFYIAHLLSSKSQADGVASESLGEWSVSYVTNSTTSHWIDEYNSIKSDLIRGSLIADASLVQMNDVSLANLLPMDRARGI